MGMTFPLAPLFAVFLFARADGFAVSRLAGPHHPRCRSAVHGGMHENLHLGSRSRRAALASTAWCASKMCEKQERDRGAESTSAEARILSIATPALASLALDPLMSAADTAFVGRMAGTGELGGLAVATTVVTVSFYMFNFLSTSTAPLVASVRASGNEEEAAELAGTALTSALIIGTGLAATIFTLAAPLSALVAGADGNPTVLQAAEGIVRIRAVGAPAALLVSAATGAFRGILDTATPFKIVAAANGLNLALDALLVPSYGASGAAAATAFSELAAAASSLVLLAQITPSITPKPPPWARPGDEAQSNASNANALASASIFTFARTLLLQITLASTTACVARDPQAATVAAHQIASQLLMLASFSADSLAVAAQVLVASASPSQGGDTSGQAELPLTRAAKDVSRSAVGLGAAFGAGAGSILWLSKEQVASLFTADPGVIDQAGWALGAVGALLPLACVVYVADGVLQGCRAFNFESRAMAAACLASGSALYFQIGHSIPWGSASASSSLADAWIAIYALFLGRGAAFALWWFSRGGMKDDVSPRPEP